MDLTSDDTKIRLAEIENRLADQQAQNAQMLEALNNTLRLLAQQHHASGSGTTNPEGDHWEENLDPAILAVIQNITRQPAEDDYAMWRVRCKVIPLSFFTLFICNIYLDAQPAPSGKMGSGSERNLQRRHRLCIDDHTLGGPPSPYSSAGTQKGDLPYRIIQL